MKLIRELNRRQVIRVALAYIVAGWFLAHAVHLAADALGAPDWLMPAAITLLLLGLPFALVFAWTYEITPDGVRHESEIDPNRPAARFTERRLDWFIIAGLVALLALGWVERRVHGTQPDVAGTVQPVLSDRAAFERHVREIGLDRHWREHGFPPMCRPIGDDDFECDIE